ncbi:unnamed protein product, partial [Ectocarpus fasciculatus]
LRRRQGGRSPVQRRRRWSRWLRGRGVHVRWRWRRWRPRRRRARRRVHPLRRPPRGLRLGPLRLRSLRQCSLRGTGVPRRRRWGSRLPAPPGYHAAGLYRSGVRLRRVRRAARGPGSSAAVPRGRQWRRRGPRWRRAWRLSVAAAAAAAPLLEKCQRERREVRCDDALERDAIV